MIYVKATMHLTGVTIQGDLDDFNDLVSAIYRMTGTSEEVGDLYETEHNRPVISDELKTKAAERNIPLPVCLAECLKAAKETSTSE